MAWTAERAPLKQPSLPSEWWISLNLPPPTVNDGFASKWKRFSDLIVSPWDGSPLKFDPKASALADSSGIRFPVWNGIPLLSLAGLDAFCGGRGLRSQASLLTALDNQAIRQDFPIYLDTCPAHMLSAHQVSETRRVELDLPQQAEHGTIVCRSGSLFYFDNRWNEVELEVQTREFDRTAQQSRVEKHSIPSDIVARLALSEPHLLHAGFADGVIQDIWTRSLASWPREPLSAEQLSRLTSRRPSPTERGQRLAGVKFRDDNSRYFPKWTSACGISIHQADALVWSSGAGYLSDVLLTAGARRVINCDERLATLPVLPDQGDDEFFVWTDPLSNPIPPNAFRLVLSHRHTVASHMDPDGLAEYVKRMDEACDRNGLCYLSLYSDMTGRPQGGWPNLTLQQILGSAQAAHLRCAQFATIGSNLSFWLTRREDVCVRARQHHAADRTPLNSQSMKHLRANDRERYYTQLAVYCGDAVIRAYENGIGSICVVGDTIFDRDLELLLRLLPLPGLDAPARFSRLKTAILIGTEASDPFIGRSKALRFHESDSTEDALPFHSGDGDGMIRQTADYYLGTPEPPGA